MEAKPVDRVRSPGYPTRREVLAGAASFVLVGLTGWGSRTSGAEGSGLGKPIVAPIFEHGEGRAITGCVVVTPPTFMTEEEGMQVIREVLSAHAIELKPGSTLPGVRIRLRTEKIETVDKGDGRTEIVKSITELPSDLAMPLKLDGVDAQKNIAVQFVSSGDYFFLGGIGGGSSVQTYRFKEAAENVAAEAKRQGTGHVFLGVFYDPVVRELPPKPPKEINDTPPQPQPITCDGPIGRGGGGGGFFAVPPEEVPAELTKYKEWRGQYVKESGKLLRQQAQDFAAWLKEQGAI